MKNDEEVVDALLAINSDNLAEIPFGYQIKALRKKPENIKVLPEASRQLVLKELPELITQIEDTELLEKVTNSSYSETYMKYLKYLPVKKQVQHYTKSKFCVKECGLKI